MRRLDTAGRFDQKHQVSHESWEEILRDYDGRYCCGCDQQIAWFQKQPSLRAAIETAARAVDARGRRFSHQYRIRREAIREATTALLAIERQLARAKSFDALFDSIDEHLRGIAGIGALYRYDTAFRIGAYLRLFPLRVYLHAGTRRGARALGLDYKKDALEISEVPRALRHRKAYEVEDILCIYKDDFAGAHRPNKPTHC